MADCRVSNKIDSQIMMIGPMSSKLCGCFSLRRRLFRMHLLGLSQSLGVVDFLIVFSSVYAQWAWKVVYGIKLELWFLGGWLPFSLTQLKHSMRF
ncbi:hypothetical protein HID58_028742 [Brassica napus]|uniref:Transmembrane protein n=1 Tax=Brassica napus TaxID=3708 RepID=A0ABQ8CB44_BRANA|nr:hypothetical protein HID58_028742 [Brassica napus]